MLAGHWGEEGGSWGSARGKNKVVGKLWKSLKIFSFYSGARIIYQWIMIKGSSASARSPIRVVLWGILVSYGCMDGKAWKKKLFVCQTTTVVIKYLQLETFEDNFNILEWSETDKHNVPIFQLKPQDSGSTTGWSGEDNNSGIFFF